MLFRSYFHVVFTLPAELRRVVRAHQKLLIGAMFGAAFESLALLAKDPRFLGASQIGALAVLHTWTRTLEWHPDIHMLVPAGGLAEDSRTRLEPKERESRFWSRSTRAQTSFEPPLQSTPARPCPG